MPNRVQTLRSSAPGTMPQAGTRAPGELWLNFADANFGYIDASQTAQKLLAVRLFVTTTSYATGDFVVYAGALYQAVAPSAQGAFTAANWSRVGTMQDLSQYLPLAGGALTGALNLPAAAPTAATQATNKSYVDVGDAAATAVANAKLPLAGGALTGALNGTTASFSGALAAASAAFSGLATAADPPDFDSSSKLVTTEWFARNIPAAKEISNRIINGNFAINQRGQVSGTALAAAAYGHDRWKAGASGCTYTFTTALPDTTITITAGSLTQIIEAGMIEGGVYTLSWTGTAQARVYQGAPAGVYAASPIVTPALPAGVNTIVEFNTGTIVRVKLEIGTVATPFNRQTMAKSLADCQRYYYQRLYTDGWLCAGQVFAAGQVGGFLAWPVTMRASPTVSTSPSSSAIFCFTATGASSTPFTSGAMTGAVNGCNFNLSGSSGLVAGNGTILALGAGNGALLANAEL
jgi:hypothetical protein